MTDPNSTSGPPGDTTWTARHGAATAVRVALFVVPVVAGALGIWLASGAFVSAGGSSLVWFVQAALVGGLVASVLDRFTRRLLPFATLLGLSLVFPGQAPSRFNIALRAARAHNTDTYLVALVDRGLHTEPALAATEAIELITILGTHRRLTAGATERLTALADATAIELGVSESDRHRLAWSVLLHDIGEITMPSGLRASSGLNPEDSKTLESHTTAGESFIGPLADWLGSWHYATSQHHEHWDGSGYPRGIGGERITLSARIVAVVEAFDELTVGQRPESAEKARAEILAAAGTRFDPTVAQAFLDSVPAAAPRGFLPTIALPGVAVHTAQAAAVIIAAGVMTAAVPTSPDLLALDATESNLASTTSITTIEGTQPGDNVASQQTPSTTARDVSLTEYTLPEFSTTTEPEPTTSTETDATSSTTAPTTGAPTTTAPTTTADPTTSPPTTAPRDTTSTTNAPLITTTTTATPTTTTPPGPVAVEDKANARSDRIKRIDVLDNDVVGPSGSPLDVDSLAIVEPPTNGTVEIKLGKVAYRSDDGFVGDDSFSYVICNELGACSSAFVTVTVR